VTNSIRGEVALGDHTLRFSVNAIIELEEEMGRGVDEIGQYMGSGKIRMKDVRTMIWIGLKDRHPEITEEEAGEVATQVGIPFALEAVGKAFALAFPNAEGGETPANGSRPPKARQAGSGSTSSPAMSKQG
jgi:hypothetical protein